MLRGFDASSVQGPLPYDKLGPEYRFVILKAQQGNDGFDPWFERNMKVGFDHGLEVFAYCFVYPLPHIKASEQAKLFVDRVHRFPQMRGRPIFLDLEWPEIVPLKPGGKGWKEWGCNPQQVSDHCHVVAHEVSNLSGAKPGLYTYDWWWAAVRDGAPAYGFPKGADASWAAEYPLWMAWYKSGWPNPGDAPKVPRPWKTWAFWQFDGNKGLVLPNGADSDFNVFNGDEEALKSFSSGRPLEALPSPYTQLVDVMTIGEAQHRLLELGLYRGKVDGLNGPLTQAALRVFQTSRGLFPDGILGPKTSAALRETPRPASSSVHPVIEDVAGRA